MLSWGSTTRHVLRYEHARAAQEQLLAVPDVVAWCWAKGGRWRQRIKPVVVNVTTVHHRWSNTPQVRPKDATDERS